MPSDANGVYSLPTGYLAVTGETILASQHNPPLEDLAASMSQRVMATGAKPFTGPVKFADGIVSAPSITFSSATSTGVYKTTDGLGVSVGGIMVAEFTAGGIRTGARYLGELIPFTGLTAQALTVLVYGQTLSRTTYAALWAFAQTEIAAGNTFYNNGNGSTTFGIGDMRGRVPAGKDNMGGSAANRLTATTMSPNSTTLGAANGGLTGETYTLVTLNLPPYTPSGSVSSGLGGSFTKGILQGGVTPPLTNVGGAASGGQIGDISVSSTFTGTAQGGTSTPMPVVQPTIITNYLLFAGA